MKAALTLSDEVAALERSARAAGHPLSAVLRAAKVDRSTWSRWRSGATMPRLDNWRAAQAAVDDLIRRPPPRPHLHIHARPARARAAR